MNYDFQRSNNHCPFKGYGISPAIYTSKVNNPAVYKHNQLMTILYILLCFINFFNFYEGLL